MLKVVKIGGNVVDNPARLRAFLVDFASLAGDKILVHGGGKVATAISAALGIETQMINGRRVTDSRTLEVVTMVYAGLNKQITATLQGLGCNAVGLCGADGELITSRRRNPQPIDYGYVGDPVAINSVFTRKLLTDGHTIVTAPITYDGSGGLLNTNADTVAQTLATGMAAVGEEVELVYCFEKQGVLLDVDDENSVVPQLDAARFAELKATGAIHSGMLPKLENAFAALEKGVRSVVICAAENIAKPDFGGTTIIK
ncbi:MAG: acetylglutamate kinase [Rikenellaceae bacterium]|jgi:acetylglutamate kinase|nr:acetylglutamate kinase [Rikenellaceae bacterium]